MELNKEQLEALDKSAEIMQQLVKDAYSKFHAAQQAHSLTGKQNAQAQTIEQAYNEAISEGCRLEAENKELKHRLEAANKVYINENARACDVKRKLEAELQCGRGDYKTLERENIKAFQLLGDWKEDHGKIFLRLQEVSAERDKLQIMLAGADMDRAADKAQIAKLNEALANQAICQYGYKVVFKQPYDQSKEKGSADGYSF